MEKSMQDKQNKAEEKHKDAQPDATNSAVDSPDEQPTVEASEPDKDATPDAEPAAPSDAELTAAVDDTPPPQKQKRSWIGVLAFLIAICALAVTGYGYQQLQQMKIELAERSDALSSDLQSNKQASNQAAQKAADVAASVEGKFQQVSRQIQTQQSGMTELQDRLTRGMQQVSKINGNSRKDWLLAEVEYLLRLANQRVLMEQSPAEALAMMQSADKILKETDDVSIYNIRKALAKDITALESVPKLDVDGLFLKLAALSDQIANLRQTPITEKNKVPNLVDGITSEAVAQSINDGLESSWNQALDKLSKLVVIQHNDEPVEPLMSPEQNFFLRQNLRLMLEQAQLALLQGQQAAYDTSLKKAHKWVGTYFEEKDATTQTLLKEIKALSGVNVAPAMPNISSSLIVLKDYLAKLHDGKGAA